MKTNSLKNNEVCIKVSPFGAELKSLQKNTVEYLWQGNPLYWKRSSPVLFPIVGRLLDNEYYLENQVYPLSQHGFARDNMFEIVEESNDFLLFKFSSNSETKKIYPFDFDLYIGYQLVQNKVEVSWKVVNTSDREMYFQIGAHPAFNFLNGSFIEINQTTDVYELDAPYVSSIRKDIHISSIEIDDTTFKNDAIILKDIDSVILKDDQKSVTLDCKGFPYIGLWSSVSEGKNAPFVCLEPWHGIADFIYHNKQLTEKNGVNQLAPNGVFETAYSITLN